MEIKNLVGQLRTAMYNHMQVILNQFGLLDSHNLVGKNLNSNAVCQANEKICHRTEFGHYRNK